MKNIREMPHWDNEFFNAWNLSRGDGDSRAFVLFMTVVVGGLLGLIPASVLIEAVGVGDGLGVFLGMLIGILFAHGVTRLGPLYKGHRIPYGGAGYPYYKNYDLRLRAKEYFSLPKSDRALYPANIIDVISDPDLTKIQRETLDRSMKATYDSIQTRNDERRMLERKYIDLTDIIEQMDDARRNTQIEIDTYREFR